MRPPGFVCFTIVLKINWEKKKFKVFQLKNNICFKWPCLGFAPAQRFTTFPSPAADFWKQEAENGRSGGSKAAQ